MVNTASPWKPPGQTSPCTQRCLSQHPSLCPGPSTRADAGPPAASPPSSSQSPKDLAQGGGTETADWTPLPRADPRPPLHGGEGVGEAFTRAGPAHPHPREPSSPARAGPLTCAETPHLREPGLGRGACGAGRRGDVRGPPRWDARGSGFGRATSRPGAGSEAQVTMKRPGRRASGGS